MKKLIDLPNTPDYNIILTRKGEPPIKLSDIEKRLNDYIDTDDIVEMMEIYKKLAFYMGKILEIINRLRKIK